MPDATPAAGFLTEPPTLSDAARALYDGDVEQVGFVMNLSRLWAHAPGLQTGLADLLGEAAGIAALTFRQRGVLVSATASTLGDSYCSLAWGARLAREVGDDVAAAVLHGDDRGLDDAERALATWARQVTRAPSEATPDQVQALRDVGYDDAQILAITTFVALRIAFSTVNGALGARPDHQLAEQAPPPVRGAVTYGRPAVVAPT